MKFKLEFDMDSAAFDDGVNSIEVGLILHNLADLLYEHLLGIGDTYPILDSYGKKIGMAKVTED